MLLLIVLGMIGIIGLSILAGVAFKNADSDNAAWGIVPLLAAIILALVISFNTMDIINALRGGAVRHGYGQFDSNKGTPVFTWITNKKGN